MSKENKQRLMDTKKILWCKKTQQKIKQKIIDFGKEIVVKKSFHKCKKPISII